MNPTADALTIRNAILDSARATPTSSLSGITVTGGRLNVGRFLGGSEPPTPPPAATPAAPTTLTATAATATQINLRWTDNATNEDGFKIERCAGSGCIEFVEVGTVGANATGATNSGLARNTTYTYRIRAFNSGGDSAYSNAASARTLRK